MVCKLCSIINAEKIVGKSYKNVRSLFTYGRTLKEPNRSYNTLIAEIVNPHVYLIIGLLTFAIYCAKLCLRSWQIDLRKYAQDYLPSMGNLSRIEICMIIFLCL